MCFVHYNAGGRGYTLQSGQSRSGKIRLKKMTVGSRVLSSLQSQIEVMITA